MITDAKYVHTNLIARDWRRLARFYEEVLGCVPTPHERDLSGPDVARGAGVEGEHVRGIHMLLPGCGSTGPTLEIFEYAAPAPGLPSLPNRPGFGHIAFAVKSVADARAQFLAAGGSAVGDIVETGISPDATVTWCYVRDPEGNIVELQSRSQGGLSTT